MAKKHGFRGTPVKPGGYSSIGRVFDTRGDPMVSPREGREKYGRNLETENPDFDRYFAEDAQRQKAAQVLKPSQIQKGNAFTKSLGTGSPKHDPQRSALNIIMKMNRKIAESSIDCTKKGSQKKEIIRGGFYEFSDREMPKEIIKNGKVYRRK